MPQQETATVDPQVSVPRQAPTTFCQQHGIGRPAVFGSALRRDAGPGSDIDLLVEFEPDRIPALPPVAAIELSLPERFAPPKVDLRPAADLSPRFRQQGLDKAEVQSARP